MHKRPKTCAMCGFASSPAQNRAINLPARPCIACAEFGARGLAGFLDGTANIPSITKQLRLPSFTYSPSDRFVWPLEER